MKIKEIEACWLAPALACIFVRRVTLVLIKIIELSYNSFDFVNNAKLVLLAALLIQAWIFTSVHT
jgi:hypothetical protein